MSLKLILLPKNPTTLERLALCFHSPHARVACPPRRKEGACAGGAPIGFWVMCGID